MRTIEQTFAERMKAEREAQGLNKQELAQRADLSATSVICYIESGRNTASLHTAAAVAGVLGVSLDWLVGLTDNKEVRK